MHSLVGVVLFLGLLATLVTAAPQRIEKRSFKVERIRNAAFKGHDGPRQLLKTYMKYHMRPPTGLVDYVNTQATAQTAAQTVGTQTKAQGQTAKGKGKKGGAAGGATAGAGSRNGTTSAGRPGNSTVGAGRPGNGTAGRGTGLVTATPERGDVEYLSPIKIGGQTVNVDFDSGSSDLWVFNTQLPAAQRAGHQAIFDPTKSQTFKMMQGASFTISYGDGSGAKGNVGLDTVDIGGAVVQNQAVELATAVSGSFIQDTQNQGLLGLAFSQLNTVKPQKQKTFFDNAMPTLAEPVFTADLRKNAVGAYEFGRIDNTKFTGQMAWVPVNTTQGFWQYSSTSFAVGDGPVQPGAPNGQAIADTGTTLLLMAPEVVNGYFRQVPGAAVNQTVGGVTVPCDAKLPDLKLDMGGATMATVKGSDIVFAQLEPNGNTCFSGLQPSPVNLMIMGDIFFKSNFVAFNGGNNTLGVAKHI